MVGSSRYSRAAVVVLNWNRPADTIDCLTSLSRLVEPAHVLVVDNGSSDDSVATIASRHPWAEYLRLDRNRGFGGGMNAGILALLTRTDRPEFVWLLNNDTTVEPAALRAMVARADANPLVGAVGSVLLDGSGDRIHEWGGGSLNRILWTTTRLLGPAPERLDYITGASVLLRVKAVLDVGLFDERYFFYLEDTDLGLRLKKAGWSLDVAAESRVRHVLGASIGGGPIDGGRRPNTLYAKSVAIFVTTWSPPRIRRALLGLRLSAMVLRRLARGQLSLIPAVVSAYAAGIRIGKEEPRTNRFVAANARG
jgi:GT2 family glycosyltransferase